MIDSSTTNATPNTRYEIEATVPVQKLDVEAAGVDVGVDVGVGAGVGTWSGCATQVVAFFDDSKPLAHCLQSDEPELS